MESAQPRVSTVSSWSAAQVKREAKLSSEKNWQVYLSCSHYFYSEAAIRENPPMVNGQLSPVLEHVKRIFGAPGLRDLTDRQLLNLFATDRDQGAFAELLHRHGSMVLSVGRRILGHEQDAEDVL